MYVDSVFRHLLQFYLCVAKFLINAVFIPDELWRTMQFLTPQVQLGEVPKLVST
jgi:hypothetical protein